MPESFLQPGKLKPSSNKCGRFCGGTLRIFKPLRHLPVLCRALAEKHSSEWIFRIQLCCLLEMRQRGRKVLLCYFDVPKEKMRKRQIRLKFDCSAQAER